MSWNKAKNWFRQNVLYDNSWSAYSRIPSSRKYKRSRNRDRPFAMRKRRRYIKRRGPAKRRGGYKRRRGRRGAPKKAMYRIARRVMDNNNVSSYRKVDSGQIIGTANECLYTAFHFLDKDHIEDAAQSIKVMVPTAGDLTATTGNPLNQNSLKIRVLGGSVHHKLRNNGVMPCKFIFYRLFTKSRLGTTDGPTTEISDGLSDMGVTSPLTDIRYYPTDSKQFLKFFKVVQRWSVTLEAGQEYTLKQSRKKPFTYNPDFFDRHTAADKQPGMSQFILCRSVGVVSHDATTHTSVGTSDYTVDYVSTMTINISSSVSSMSSKRVIEAGALDAQTTPNVAQETTEIVAEEL